MINWEADNKSTPPQTFLQKILLALTCISPNSFLEENTVQIVIKKALDNQEKELTQISGENSSSIIDNELTN
ncbi:hypothetical protein [Candidatus Tisiphia endosymbiont of Beris chalybata]|uniref:hypothetical protein n=1 Tax=Candidatus Tisiphia endosymbiont of Beris chalybata TaxID=3066262 RepID=UPI00312CA189